MRLRLPVIAAAIITLSVSLAARADEFNFSFSNGTSSGSGTLTTQTTGTTGEYLINDISGMADGLTIQSLLPAGTYPLIPGPPNDNLLFYPDTGNGYLDLQGLSFQLSNGDDVNIFLTVSPSISSSPYLIDTNYDENTVPATFSVSAVTPEPTSIVLLGTGLLGVAGVLRRRFV